MKKWELSILTGLIIAIIITQFSAFALACQEVRQDTLRLHVRAHSNSEEDQACKLAVRDAVIEQFGEQLSHSENIEHSIITARALQLQITNAAQEIVASMGFDYDVNVNIQEEYFSVIEYDNFTLPAGTYYALSIEIGSALGENWFCVLYPALCLPSAMENSEMEIYSSGQEKAIKSPYEIKFALLEWLEF